MSVNREQICRFCLKMRKKEFVKIDEVIKQMCDILLLKLDLDIMDSTICLDCVKVAKKCLNFKAICIYAEKTILSFSISRKKVKHNMKLIYKDNKSITVAEDLDICRFCMTQSERSNFVSWDTLANETAFEMLPEYMPELDCNIIENPMICTTCREILDDYFKFVLKCSDIERKIKSYCGEVETDSRNQAKLTDSLKFYLKGILEYPDKSPQIDEIKEKLNTSENTVGIYHEIFSGLTTPEEEQFINEEINFVEYPKEAASSIKHNNDVEFLQNYTSVHKNVSEVKMHNCPLCPYKAKQKGHIKRHMLVHSDASEIKMHKCPLCAYEAKQKGNLKRHMLVHSDAAEIKMHKCLLCPYESKHKSCLKSHGLVHKNASEIEMYDCPLCDTKIKYKRYLKTHMSRHENFIKQKNNVNEPL